MMVDYCQLYFINIPPTPSLPASLYVGDFPTHKILLMFILPLKSLFRAEVICSARKKYTPFIYQRVKLLDPRHPIAKQQNNTSST